jgi:hypothetical protein
VLVIVSQYGDRDAFAQRHRPWAGRILQFGRCRWTIIPCGDQNSMDMTKAVRENGKRRADFRKCKNGI